MKAVLLCPGHRPAVASLAESQPLVLTPLLGRCLLAYWIEHLVALGVHEIAIIASDRPALIRDFTGDGAQWGVPITVTGEPVELSVAESTARHGTAPAGAPASVFVVLLDHLPGQSEPRLFASYAAWFAGLQAWMPQAQVLERIGQCEISPGVWVGLRTRIDPSARLLAPCWIGDYVTVQAQAVIGPWTILEEGVVIADEAQVAQSIVGPATFVGAQTRIENSLALHHTLINWATDSRVHVPAAFWLSSLRTPAPVARPTAGPTALRLLNDGTTLTVTHVAELSSANAVRFRTDVHAALSTLLSVVEIDLTDTCFVDSQGLATLCGLHRSVGALGISLRLLHPTASVRQLLELTQMHRFLGIDEMEPAWPGLPRPAVRRSPLNHSFSPAAPLSLP